MLTLLFTEAFLSFVNNTTPICFCNMPFVIKLDQHFVLSGDSTHCYVKKNNVLCALLVKLCDLKIPLYISLPLVKTTFHCQIHFFVWICCAPLVFNRTLCSPVTEMSVVLNRQDPQIRTVLSQPCLTRNKQNPHSDKHYTSKIQLYQSDNCVFFPHYRQRRSRRQMTFQFSSDSILCLYFSAARVNSTGSLQLQFIIHNWLSKHPGDLGTLCMLVILSDVNLGKIRAPTEI